MADPDTIDQTSRADAAAPLATESGKAIVLFSDGTGNSSGKLFKTNVFRLYQAMDLGASDCERTQVAYYDNGVGTSSVKVLAVLGGVFGFGLKPNMLHLYRFLCRNYNPGDKIYAFGFSRGAFTIRLLVALICTQGVVSYKDERELGYNSADAFYRFIDENGPDVFTWFWVVVRTLRDVARLGWRRLRGRPVNVQAAHRPDVEFVGVWDTVAAYGGPISEITRGIDKYVWPLTMTDYELHPKVKAARHALALDDERDSFSPLLWDEVSEARLVSETQAPELQERYRTRLKQVWFAGMHADVGGGYPDDSLAYVSLVWMLDEIDGKLRFLPDEERRIRGFANTLGPMHDSRQGLGTYYRYQPRKISAFLHCGVPDTLEFDQTLSLRDPTIGEKRTPPQGLLLSCRVHDSVIDRIGAGTDNYAPIGLPRDFTVVRSRAATPDLGPTDAAIARLENPEIAAARGECQENAWDDVWRRRVGYFVVVALTLVLVASPLYATRQGWLLRTDSRWLPGIVIGWFAPFVPAMAGPWFEAFRLAWPTFLLVGLAIGLVSSHMNAQAQRLGDALRIAWWDAIAGKSPRYDPPTRLRLLRNSRRYQWSLQVMKWRVLPFLFGGAMLAFVMLYVPAIIAVQAWRTHAESRGVFCAQPATQSRGTSVTSVTLSFDAAAVCRPVNAVATGGHRYRLVIRPEPVTGKVGWTYDGSRVPWGGQRSWSFPWGRDVMMLLGSPFRRVLPAGWLEPLVEIRGAPVRLGRFTLWRRVSIQRLALLQAPRANREPILVGEFKAPFRGSLHFFLNDAAAPPSPAAPFPGLVPASNRTGRARICIEDADRAADPILQGCGTAQWRLEEPAV